MSDEEVKVRPLSGDATALSGVWVVSRGSRELLKFDGTGAKDRAEAYVEGIRKEIRAGTFEKKSARGTCSKGERCDRDRIHVMRLSDLSDEQMKRVVLCAGHLAEARPGTRRSPVAGSTPAEAPPGGSGTPAPVAGRRRKQPAPSPGGSS